MTAEDTPRTELYVIRIKKRHTVVLFVAAVVAIVFAGALYFFSAWGFEERGGFYFSILLATVFLISGLITLYDKIEIDAEKIVRRRLWKRYQIRFEEIESIRLLIFSRFEGSRDAQRQYQYRLVPQRQYAIKATGECAFPSLEGRLEMFKNLFNMPLMRMYVAADVFEYYEWLRDQLRSWFLLAEGGRIEAVTFSAGSGMQKSSRHLPIFDERKLVEVLVKFGGRKCERLGDVLDLSYECFLAAKTTSDTNHAIISSEEEKVGS